MYQPNKSHIISKHIRIFNYFQLKCTMLGEYVWLTFNMTMFNTNQKLKQKESSIDNN